MSDVGTPPGGLSVKEFKLATVEISQWIWGTVQGAFNEKQTLAQIIADAVIGMVPLVGDVTAARDLIAVGTGLATEQKKREQKTEWVLLVILLFALIPVIGGVIKGVGRIALRISGLAAHEIKLLEKVSDDIIRFLNRMGHKNAEAWFRSLNVMSYQAQIIAKFRAFCDTVIVAIYRYGLRFERMLPQSFVGRLQQLSNGFKQLKSLGDKMIPEALKDLNFKLQQLQRFVHSGGKPVRTRAQVLEAQTGRKAVSYAEEARLLEGKTPVRIRKAGKFRQNLSDVDRPEEIAKVYKYEPGFPNLLARPSRTGGYHPAIAAASGKIENKMLSGTTVFRAFGPGDVTHGVKVGESYPVGAFWGIGSAPKSGELWRNPCAVLDEWNANGRICAIHIPEKLKIPACVSTVSEQFGLKIPGQFLEGGARQAIIEFDDTVRDIATKLADNPAGGTAVLPNGMVIEVGPSNWVDVSGKIGYDEVVIPSAAMVERLGVTEKQTKVVSQSAQATLKNERMP